MAATTAAAHMTPSSASASPAVIWAMLCAASGIPLPLASSNGSSDQDAAASSFPIGLLDVRYLPLMPLPRSASARSSGSGSRKRGQRRSRTNSERGKEFRARQRDHEVNLLKQITALQSEVHKLQVTRDLHCECALQTRQSGTGSLMKLVREYHKLFFMGAPEVIVGEKRMLGSEQSYADLIGRQHQFLRHAIDPDLILGKQRGVGALMENWKRYTKYHRNLRMTGDEFVVSGSEDKPIITVQGTIRVRYTRDTIQYLFPHAIHDEALVQNFIGKEIAYKYRNIYEFGDDGCITTYIPEVEFVQALLDAGGSIQDVAALMQQAQIAGQYILGPVDEDGGFPSTIEVLDEPMGRAGASPRPATTQSSSVDPKLQLDYLLSTAMEEDGESDIEESCHFAQLA
ncbi:hypothetical protein Gpo141_00013071 [Globisporangium polare]